MEQSRFITNIIDQIKEAQIKLGYARETVRLYYPAASLVRLLDTGTDPKPESAEELLKYLRDSKELADTVLGPLKFAGRGERIEVCVSPQGAEYVHQKVPAPRFLSELIELFGTHHHCSLEEIRSVFAGFCPDYVCERMPEGADFDYVLYFPEGVVDPYYYCVKEEMEHTIYHRFTREDFQALCE